MQSFYRIFWLAVLSTGTVWGDECPTDSLKSLDTTFDGIMTVLAPSGEVRSLVTVSETHVVTNCNAYTAHILYKDAAGNVTREQSFSARWDADENLFKLSGGNISGSFRVLKPDTFFVNFTTQFATGPANCDELISITNQGKELSRTLHCYFGGPGGVSMGTRAVQGVRR